MSVIHVTKQLHFSIAVPRTVRLFVLSSLIVGLGAVAFGPAIDYVRVEQFKSRLQSAATDAALSGAVAYTDRTAADQAENAATDSFTGNDDYRDGLIGSPMISVMATPTNMYGQNGYGVTVKLRADIDKRFDLLSPASSQTVTVTAMALNPVGKRSAR